MDAMQKDLLKKALDLFESHEYAYAYTLLADLFKQNPHNNQIQHYLHTCGIKKYQTNPDSVIKYWIKTIIFTPYDIYALFTLLIEDNLKARLTYEKLIRLFPVNLRFFKKLVLIYERSKTAKTIQFLLEEIRLIDPLDQWALKRLGEVYLKQGQLSEARKIYDQLRIVYSEDPEVIRGLKNLVALETLKKGPFHG